MIIEPYRPSNGAEWLDFKAVWCNRCPRHSSPRYCSIIFDASTMDVDHPDYPPEWVEDDAGPRCTAFEEITP